jgi:uncharacterized protein YheU (UPF0270 family)
VVESFVVREGADYGERETPHQTKCRQVMQQLEQDESDRRRATAPSSGR